MKVKEGLKAIAIKAAFVKGKVEIKLYRERNIVGVYDIFGYFDGSFN